MPSGEMPLRNHDKIRNLFNSIASRYDFLNHWLSFRLDESWRKSSCDLLLSGREKSLLDLGTGTGQFLSEFLSRQKWNSAVGLDFSPKMIETAKKVLGPLNREVSWVEGNFESLPFPAESFDLIVSAFTLRSVLDLPSFFRGVCRILSPGGKAGFLCLTRPTSPVLKLLFYPYLKVYLPVAGFLFSGDRKAYQYLADSIMNFQDPEETAKMMGCAGFKEVKIHSFSMGLATLLIGQKG